jgi:hypothetical protein
MMSRSLRPNALRITCAAPIDQYGFRTESSFQNRRELEPRSGVGCMRLFGARRF